MGINVNFYDKVIYITSPTTSVTVQQLVDAIRLAEDSGVGINFEKVIDATGKDDLGSGITTGITMALSSDWYIEFWDGVSKGIITSGNVVGGKDDKPIRADPNSINDTVLVLSSVGATIVPGALSTTQDTKLMGLPSVSDIESSTVIAKQSELIRAVGLLQENHFLDNTVYTEYSSGQKLLTSGRVRLYSNSSSVGTDSDVIGTYNITATWEDNKLLTYKVVKA